MRPDIYKWLISKDAVIDKAETQGWISGWFTFDVRTYMLSEPGRMNRPWIRLSTNFTAGEAAMHIIERVDNGYWFAGEFRTDQILLDGANDFATVEAFGKWQQWYAQECARTGLLGYEVVSSWYSLQFTGVDMIMTAIDAQQNGLNWTHALNLFDALPFLAKLEIPVSIRNANGTEAFKVLKSEKGLRVISNAAYGAGTFSQGFTHVPQKYRDVIAVGATGCTEGCAEMILLDFKVDISRWAVPTQRVAHNIDEIRDWLVASGVKAPIVRAYGNADKTDFYFLVNEIMKTKRPSVFGVTNQLNGRHAVIVDGFECINGATHVIFRDPGPGLHMAVPVTEFLAKWTGEAVYWLD